MVRGDARAQDVGGPDDAACLAAHEGLGSRACDRRSDEGKRNKSK
jgi:hypothetical protein